MSDLASKIIALSPATTAGSGELNLVGSPSNGSGWLSANGGGTLSTTSTAGDLPLGPAVTTAIKITSGTGASNEAALAETNSFAFTTPAAYAVKTKVELWMRPGSNFINSEWTVSVYAGSTRQALTTDSSSFTYLPNANGKFTTYFDAVASTAYTVRLTRKLNALTNAGVLNVTNVILGPGIQPQGAVVGPELGYTPTLNAAWGSSPNIIESKYTMIGDKYYIRGFIIVGTSPTGSALSVSFPGNFTSANTQSLASGSAVSTTGTDITRAVIVPTSSTTFGFNASSNWSANQLTGTAVGAGNAVAYSFIATLNELLGSGTVNLAQNDVEYAWNNGSATNADDTSSFGYGPDGTAVINFDTGGRSRTVRFQTPRQATDKIFIEFNNGNGWFDYAINFTRISQLTTQYGVTWFGAATNTDISITFSSYADTYNNGSYGGAGRAWSVFNTWKWRVRKVSGGQAVGFGAFQAASSTNPAGISGLVPALGLPGRTDGVAVAAGYVGQVIENSSTTVNSIASTPQQVATVTLTPGVWLVCAYGYWGADSTARFMQLFVSTTANSSAGTSQNAGTAALNAGWNGPAGLGATSLNPVPIYVTTNTSYYLNVYVSSISGLGGQVSRLQAVRIA